MPQIHEIGRAYVQFIRLNSDAPIIHSAPTYETEWPYRVGRSRIFRLWPTEHAVVVGVWVRRIDNPHLAELTALRAVMETRRTDTPYWCRYCGRGEAQCYASRHDDGDDVDPCRGYCPACDSLWDDCTCLEDIDWRYAGGPARNIAAAVSEAVDGAAPIFAAMMRSSVPEPGWKDVIDPMTDPPVPLLDARRIICDMARQLSVVLPDGSPSVYVYDGRFYPNAAHLWGRS